MQVLTTDELLRRYELAKSAELLAGTGFAELDAVTGGFCRGRVWVVLGRPGGGKTTLATQWAARLASADLRVQLACPREPTRWVTARLLAGLGTVPLRDLTEGVSASGRTARMEAARARLAELRLCVFPEDEGSFVPEEHPYTAAARPDVIVVDDADLVGGMTPRRAGRFRAEGFLIIITLPRHLVVLGEGDEAPVDPSWGRVADVIVEVRHRYLPLHVPTAPDDELAAVFRPGEADLVLHHHRWGPTRTLGVGFQGHYAQFVDLG